VDLAIATVRYLIANQKKLLGSVAQMSDYFRDRLTQMPFRRLSVQGLAICAELENEEQASRIEKKCRRNGLLITSEEAKLLLLPALNIDHDTAEKGLDTLANCF
jgi:acetylornithine/succinyldiaminopimelate/putrescine aminotransferase